MSRPLAGRLGAFAAAIALATAACGTGSDSDGATPPPSPPTTSPAAQSTTTSSTEAPAQGAVRTIEVELAGGSVVGGPRREAVRLGEQVRIRASSDVAEELHVHTYDVRAELRPGEPAEVSFTATIPGRHEVEFEKSRKVALTLEVR